MNCPNCHILMISSPSFGERVTVTHTCPNCQHRHVVTFDKPKNEFNPFDSTSKIWMAQRMFAIELGDWYYAHTIVENPHSSVTIGDKIYHFGGEPTPKTLDNLAVEKTVTYVDMSNGKRYEWQAIAYVEGRTIYRYLYLNGKLYTVASFILHSTNNPFNRWLSDPKEAALAALAEAENVTKAMARGEWANE